VKKITIIFILAGILTNSCVDQLDVNIDREEFILVVEGFITTEAGPHNIRISRSAKYGPTFNGVIRPVLNAEVFIRDQNGKVTFLNEESGEYPDPSFNPIVTSFGIYTTPTGFSAVVGNSYTLQITVSGKTYYSTPQLVIKAPAIDSLILQYKELLSLDPIEFASGDFVSGVEVYSQWQDPENETNYYIWKSSGTYKISARPWDHVIIPGFGPPIPIPDPKDCCAVCWIHEPISDKSIRIMKDKNSNGNLITNLVAFIEDDGGRYMDKYYITVQQLSISEEAYLFFKLLNNQLSINGDIFDPPPATIRGNMISQENPNENVIGYFMAADVSVKSIFISKEILGDRQILKVINDDCRVLINSTVQPPSFWE